MQDAEVLFVIRIVEQKSWLPVVATLQDRGYTIETDVRPADITVVLSGTFLNPLAMPGRRLLVCHTKEWGSLWDSVYQYILKEYYHKILIIDKIPLNQIPDKIRGMIEAEKHRGPN